MPRKKKEDLRPRTWFASLDSDGKVSLRFTRDPEVARAMVAGNCPPANCDSYQSVADVFLDDIDISGCRVLKVYPPTSKVARALEIMDGLTKILSEKARSAVGTYVEAMVEIEALKKAATVPSA